MGGAERRGSRTVLQSYQTSAVTLVNICPNMARSASSRCRRMRIVGGSGTRRTRRRNRSSFAAGLPARFSMNMDTPPGRKTRRQFPTTSLIAMYCRVLTDRVTSNVAFRTGSLDASAWRYAGPGPFRAAAASAGNDKSSARTCAPPRTRCAETGLSPQPTTRILFPQTGQIRPSATRTGLSQNTVQVASELWAAQSEGADGNAPAAQLWFFITGVLPGSSSDTDKPVSASDNVLGQINSDSFHLVSPSRNTSAADSHGEIAPRQERSEHRNGD